MKLNVGCGTHYADGWVNTDVWESETTKPDVRVDPGARYPFDDDTFDAIYMGHVLEHIRWDDVHEFLVEMGRIAKPGCNVLVVGPDVYRTIRRWASGDEPWFMVESTLEHADVHWQPGRSEEQWDGATHHWNCHADRLGEVLIASGFSNVVDVSDVITNNFIYNDERGRWWDDPDTGIRWPVVQKAAWQCGFRCSA